MFFSRRLRHLPNDDRGALLPITMVLTIVFGVTAAALASYGAVSHRHHRVVRAQTALRAAAEAGMREAIERLRLHQTLCADDVAATEAVVETLPTQINGATIAITCSYDSGNLPGANQWAAILTGIGVTEENPAISSEAGAGTTKLLDGPVYLGITGPINLVSELKSPVSLMEGDLWFYSPTCSSGTPKPTIENLGYAPTPPRFERCTAKPWQLIAPMPGLPPKPLPIDPSGRDDLVPGCRIFFPGAYSEPPAIQSGDNYFVSGEYYFEFDDTLEFNQADVQAGQPDPYSDDVPQISNLAPSCATATDNQTVKDAETGWGATFILAGRSRLSIDQQARVEVFSRVQQGGKTVSIQAVETAGAGYNASTITVADGPIVWMHPGNTNDLVLHGMVRVPQAQVAFGNVTNTVAAQASGGLVAASIDLQGSGSASAWMIGRANRPATTRVLMISRATNSSGISVSVRAVVDYRFSRIVKDASLYDGSNLFVSNSAQFTSADIGSVVVSTGLPPQTKITQIVSPTAAFLSADAVANQTNGTVTIRTPEVAINSWRRA